MNGSRSRRREVNLPYEKTYLWEDERGSTAERTVRVNNEAKRVYAQQEQMLSTLTLERPSDPEASDHLQDVGRRVLILRDTTKNSRKKIEHQLSPQQSPKRVIPSRFPEVKSDFNEEDAGEPDRVEAEEESVLTDGRIATMLMDQEWDTRTWNTTKIQTAVDTLYEEIELSEDESRRNLAITMLLRLLETHEDAVDYVETTLPSLTNKAFRTLSKLTNNTQIFRMARLVALLAEWFPHVLSSENAVNKSINCLLRETELCARILQHHRRGVLFERSVNQRDIDPIVRTRLRSMHMIKFVELRHQFNVFREAIGPGGIPSSVTQAYVTILYHLVKLKRDIDPISSKTRSTVLSDQRRILGSGVLVFLASLMTKHQKREVVELVKGIVLKITQGNGNEQIVEILQCNVVQRVQLDLICTLQASADDLAAMTTSLQLLTCIAAKVLQATELWGSSKPSSSTSTRNAASPTKDSSLPSVEERRFLLRKLKTSVQLFLVTADVFDTLFDVLCYCRYKSEQLRAQVLEILYLIACSLGFTELLDALTRCGGRWLEQVLVCMKDTNLMVAQAAVTLFYEITSRTDARYGLTTAGAVQIFMRWCRPNLQASESQMAFVMGLVGCVLLARQTDDVKPVASLLTALENFNDRLDALYTLLLDLALQDETCARASEKTAAYFLSVNVLPTLIAFLTQVSPSFMDSPVQNSRQRNISCILISRLCKASKVANACFSEDVVNHLSLSIQCNRLDEIEGLLAHSSSEDRFIHQLGSKEACKALSRLSRCPSNMVDTRLRPSLTSLQVPEWPQALICDVFFRMHVLEDLIALIRHPSDVAEFAPVELAKVLAAVELAGYIRPLPYGESVRDNFLKTHANHPHGQFAQEKLLQLVKLVAPAILHLLREKSIGFDLVSGCCVTLSRLACTNAACSLLLSQGCLQTALVHFPEILITIPTNKRRIVEFDASIDDHGLLDVPASFYTLLGKLCAVADGRTGIMRAQVLPRLLKRMQLRHPTCKMLDVECKSEIAVVIARLAMVNAVEGSTSELFLHFKVLELLTKVLKEHRDLLSQTTVVTSSKKNKQVEKWRLLVHAVGAIAALSQDVLVCVPRVVSLGIVELLFPFLARLGRNGNSNFHLESLQYDAVTILRSIASYPFGEFHTYLTTVKGLDLENEEKKPASTRGKSIALVTMVMDRVKQIGYDFAMELQNKPMTLRDRKSVGELARETMAFINEHQQQQERELEHRRILRIAGSKNQQSGRLLVVPIKKTESKSSFPVLPQSPLSRLNEFSGSRFPLPGKITTEISTKSAFDTSMSIAPSILVLDGGLKSPVSLNGVNIASTRPPGNIKPRISSESVQNHGHFVFTTPKTKTKRRDHDPANGLMLDPLFDSSSALIKSRKLPSSDDDGPDGYSFSHEVDRFGHYANVQALRSNKGSRYFPSLGRIVTSETSTRCLEAKTIQE